MLELNARRLGEERKRGERRGTGEVGKVRRTSRAKKQLDCQCGDKAIRKVVYEEKGEEKQKA